jgi:hypothetical protein
MDKGAKDKLARSPGENGGQDVQKYLHPRHGRDKTTGKTQEKMEIEVERGFQVLGVIRRTEMVTDRGKNGRTLFKRPKPTAGCSANGRRRRRSSLIKHREKFTLHMFKLSS